MDRIFDLCVPRGDVVGGEIGKSDFAADLAQVIKGTASEEYRDARLFFANTYPTRGLKSLLANVCARLSGKPGYDRFRRSHEEPSAPGADTIRETTLESLRDGARRWRSERGLEPRRS